MTSAAPFGVSLGASQEAKRMRSDVYGLYTQIRSSIYNKDYDFTKDIERYQKKFAQFNDDQSAQ